VLFVLQYVGEEGWEDPRERGLIVVHLSGLELTFHGADLFQEGDSKFNLCSYTRDDSAGVFDDGAFDLEAVLQVAVLNGRALQCVKWKGSVFPGA
jgi:hypothetical protein